MTRGPLVPLRAVFDFPAQPSPSSQLWLEGSGMDGSSRSLCWEGIVVCACWSYTENPSRTDNLCFSLCKWYFKPGNAC